MRIPKPETCDERSPRIRKAERTLNIVSRVYQQRCQHIITGSVSFLHQI